MAKLYFRYGAMNSGKSSALLQVAYNYEERGQHILLVKPSVDLKGEDYVVSRVGGRRRVNVLAHDDSNLYEEILELKKVKQIDCVLVDEAQFLQSEQVDQLFALTLEGIPVIAFGLKIDFAREVFPGSARLLALAHSLEELKTICRCGRKATFNGRKNDGQWVTSGEQVIIDELVEAVTYESLCGHCYSNNIKPFI